MDPQQGAHPLSDGGGRFFFLSSSRRKSSWNVSNKLDVTLFPSSVICLAQNSPTAGVKAIRTTIADTNTANLEYDRAKSHVTFTDRFGEALAQRLRTWTSVNFDANLPEVHRVLLKTPKGLQYGALNALLQECAAALGASHQQCYYFLLLASRCGHLTSASQTVLRLKQLQHHSFHMGQTQCD